MKCTDYFEHPEYYSYNEIMKYKNKIYCLKYINKVANLFDPICGPNVGGEKVSQDNLQLQLAPQGMLDP